MTECHAEGPRLTEAPAPAAHADRLNGSEGLKVNQFQAEQTGQSFRERLFANACNKTTFLPLVVGTYWGVCSIVGSCIRHYQISHVAQTMMPADWAAAQAPVDSLAVSVFWGVAVVYFLFGFALLGLISLAQNLVPAPDVQSEIRFVPAPLIRLWSTLPSLKIRIWALWTLKAVFFIYSSNTVVRSLGIPGAADMTLGANAALLWPAIYDGGKTPSDSRVDGKGDLGSKLCVGDSCSQRIEKIIHQTYITANQSTWPENWRDTPAAWKKKHPDWEYKFWTDESARAFIQTEYPWFLSHFDGYQFPIQRADAIRYFALYHYGGIYADLDLQPKLSLDAYLVDTDVVLFETPNGGLTNMIVASRKGSPFMKCVAAKLASYQWQLHHEFAHLRAWRILTGTGPTYLWAMTSQSLCGHSFVRHEEKLRIISGPATGRCSLCGGTDLQKCAADGLLRHIQGSSWHRSGDGVKFMNFTFLCHPGVVAGLALMLAIVVSIMERRSLSLHVQAPRGLQVLLLIVMNYFQMFPVPVLNITYSQLYLGILVMIIATAATVRHLLVHSRGKRGSKLVKYVLKRAALAALAALAAAAVVVAAVVGATVVGAAVVDAAVVAAALAAAAVAVAAVVGASVVGAAVVVASVGLVVDSLPT